MLLRINPRAYVALTDEFIVLHLTWSRVVCLVHEFELIFTCQCHCSMNDIGVGILGSVVTFVFYIFAKTPRLLNTARHSERLWSESTESCFDEDSSFLQDLAAVL